MSRQPEADQVLPKSDRIRRWHVPLSHAEKTMSEALHEMSDFALKPDEIPLLIRLIENPEFDLPLIDLFHGATNLRTHDCIHVLLGRGLMPKDEAFVLGFTMGSTDRVSATEEKLYTLAARYLFPKFYRFDAEDVRVFKDAVRLGYISDTKPLNTIDYDKLMDTPIAQVRDAIGLEEGLLRAYYQIEMRRYPSSFESQRLLD